MSRARGSTTAYGVAASELLDADLGPATCELDDEAHDIRVGAERVAAEFSAGEVSDRKRIEAVPEDELTHHRRRLLDGREDAPPRPGGVDERLTAIDLRIAELEAASPGVGGVPAETAIAMSVRRMAADQLSRLRAERAEIAEGLVGPPTPDPRTDRSDHAELALIEDRLLELRRRRVRAERISPSQTIVEALGPRPPDALGAALWNEGVDAIVTYRQLQDVVDGGRDPLGPRPTATDERRARVDAERRLRQVQNSLRRRATPEVERVADLSR